MMKLLNETWRARYERQKWLLFCFSLYSSLFALFPEGFSDGTYFEHTGRVTGSKILGGYYLCVGIYASEIVSGLLNSYEHRLIRIYPSGSEALFDACAGGVMLVITTILYYVAGGFKYVVFPEYLFVLIFPAYLLGKNIWWWHRAR